MKMGHQRKSNEEQPALGIYTNQIARSLSPRRSRRP